MAFQRTCEKCGSEWDAGVAFCPRDGQSLGPATLDRYVLVRAVAHTGMSEVFEAKHQHTGRRVALKLIRASSVGHDDTTERLRREGRAASAIGDPNIVDVTDFGDTDDGGVYMVMEWLEGQTVRELLDEGPVRMKQALDLAAQTASGLAAAHSIGVIHRDIKPENLMVIPKSDGSAVVKILDFGIAKVAGPEIQKLTRTGTIIGTPAYMAPEQARGEEVDARSDVYSLGCLIYELLTGSPPFTSSSVMEVVLMHVDAEPTLPSAFAPSRKIPDRIDQVIMRCLAKNPDDRYSSMTALRSALEAIGSEDFAGSKPTTEELDAARTLHYRAAEVPASSSATADETAEPAQTSRPAPSSISPPVGLSRSRLPIFFGLAFVAIAAIVSVSLLTQDDKSVDTDSVAQGESRRDEATSAAIPAGASDAAAAMPGASVPMRDAGPLAGPIDGANSESTLWSTERAHSKFRIVLSAPAMLSARAPIDLGFALEDLKEELSWAVTEGRLQARIEFVHFVRHDTIGRVTANVDDTGRFRAILSVPQTGKYHLKIRLSDGSKVVGRSRLDICVGARPGTAAAESLCPQFGQFSGSHSSAR